MVGNASSFNKLKQVTIYPWIPMRNPFVLVGRLTNLNEKLPKLGWNKYSLKINNRRQHLIPKYLISN